MVLEEQVTSSPAAQQSPALLSSLQDTEIINTAILTGRTVAIPVKVIAIEVTGLVLDVSALVECESDNEDIIKVGFLEVGPLERKPRTFSGGMGPQSRGGFTPQAGPLGRQEAGNRQGVEEKVSHMSLSKGQSWRASCRNVKESFWQVEGRRQC